MEFFHQIKIKIDQTNKKINKNFRRKIKFEMRIIRNSKILLNLNLKNSSFLNEFKKY